MEVSKLRERVTRVEYRSANHCLLEITFLVGTVAGICRSDHVLGPFGCGPPVNPRCCLPVECDVLYSFLTLKLLL